MKKQLFPILSALLILSGCGGGGGGGAPATPDPAPANPAPAAPASANPTSQSKETEQKQIEALGVGMLSESREALRKAPQSKARMGSVVQSTNIDNGNNNITKDGISIDITGSYTEPVYVIGYHANPEIDDTPEDSISINTAQRNNNEYYFENNKTRGNGRYQHLVIGGSRGRPFDVDGDNRDDGRLVASIYSDYGHYEDWIAAGLWGYIPETLDQSGIIFGAFADGNSPFAADDIGNLDGRAEYTGGAIGLYSVRHSDDSLSLNNVYADVALTVNFGINPTIRGGFTGIKTYDGERKTRDGQIELRPAAISGTEEGGFFTGQLAGRLDGLDFTGNWGGQLYGDFDGYPSRIAGTAAAGTDPATGLEVNFIAAYVTEHNGIISLPTPYRFFGVDVPAQIASVTDNLIHSKPRKGDGSIVQSSRFDPDNNGITRDEINIDISGNIQIPRWSVEFDGDADGNNGAEETININTGTPPLQSQVRHRRSYQYNNLPEGEKGRVVGHDLWIEQMPFDADGDNRDDGIIIAQIDAAYNSNDNNDAEYLAAGLWFYAPNYFHADNIDDITFGAFADGSNPFTAIGSAAGTAYYDGDAEIWVILDNGGIELDAEVNLIAEFNSPNPMISGAFTGEFNANLQSALIDSEGFFRGALNGIFGDTDFNGHWGGRFYGGGSDQPDWLAGTAAGGGSGPRKIRFIAAYAGNNVNNVDLSADKAFLGALPSAPITPGVPDTLNNIRKSKPYEGIHQSTNIDDDNNTADQIWIIMSDYRYHPRYRIGYDANASAHDGTEVIFETRSMDSPAAFYQYSKDGNTYQKLIIGDDIRSLAYGGTPPSVQSPVAPPPDTPSPVQPPEPEPVLTAETPENKNNGIPFLDGELSALIYSNYDRNGDTDYVAGGVWLYVPDDIEANSPAFGAFVDGHGTFTDFSRLSGSATYRGEMLGLYSVKHADDSLSFSTLSGEAQLTADFDAGNPRISGTFTNIQTNNGEIEQRAGSINLNDAMSDGHSFSGTLDGTIDGIDISGHWGGKFYQNNDDQPSWVAGTAGGGGDDASGQEINFSAMYMAKKQ